jgi:hypothetical protein
MATTTATITINSTDLLTDELSLSSTSTLTTAGTSTGVTQASGLSRKTTATVASASLIDSEVLYRADDYTADKANKVYIKNTSTAAAQYFEILITGGGGTAGSGVTELGRLYAGDWAFFPWNATGGVKETFVTTIGGTWVIGDEFHFDGVEVKAATTTVASIATQIDEAQFPNWVTSRAGAVVTFVARDSRDDGTVVIVTADMELVQSSTGATAVVSAAALGTKSLSDIYIKPGGTDAEDGMTYECMLIHE